MEATAETHLVAARSHRGTRAIRLLVEYAPATGGLALWMRHVDVAPAAIPGLIANDGRAVFYAPSFPQLPLPEQVGWVAHQVLHVAFRHVPRRAALEALLGEVDAELYNVCADAIVNSTIAHLPWLALPPAAIRLDGLLGRCFGTNEPVEKSLLAWDVERLYRAVDDRRTHRSGRSGQAAQRGEGAGSRPSEAEGTRGARRVDGPRSTAVRAVARQMPRDLLPSAEAEAPEEAAAKTREWAERLQRGHADDGEFSMLRALVADVPRSRVPWRQLLRVSIARALVREPTVSWSRPSRSWLANRGRTAGGRRLPWEPGMIAARMGARLAVIVDVSGSIDDELLKRLATELRALSRRAEADGVLVLGDDQVRDVRRFAPGRLDVRDVACEGGGGTNFEPLLAEAARHAPDIAVVLTDLKGPAGPRPAFPVLWAVPWAALPGPPPFGRLVLLE